MKCTKFLRVTTLGFVLTFHNAHAMLDVESPTIPVVKQSLKINLSGYENEKLLGVILESQNLFMRNLTDNKGDLDYYFQIFSNKITMEKYMQGIPRPSHEIITRHQKYFSWWQDGNPFSSYLTFLNEDASRRFLSEQELLVEPFNAHLSSFPTEKIPLKDETLKGTQILLSSLKKEFENSKKIFIGHVLLEPGEDRDLKTDAEVSYVFLPAFWGRGYATEAVENLVELAKVFRQKAIKLDSQHIDTLIATARPDNPGSYRVLEKNKFTLFKEEEKFGALRRLYILGL